jgi:hypothetical protein
MLLDHKNVLQLKGICYKPNESPGDSLPCFVSPWMEAGTARNYLRKKENGSVNFKEFVSLYTSVFKSMTRLVIRY